MLKPLGLAVAAAGLSLVSLRADTRILDQTAYFRCYYRLMPDALDAAVLRAEGDTLLGATALRRLETVAARRMELQTGAAVGDWMAHATARFRTGALGTYPPPPTDWMQPEFDDRAWVRRRTPMQMGTVPLTMPETTIRDAYPHIRASYFRAWFEVADPQRDAPLMLWLQYRGGVRVLINGHEVARGHLPAGALDADALAEPYPLEAYVLLPEELDEAARGNLPDPEQHARDYYRALFLARDLPMAYEQAAAEAGDAAPYLSQPVWDRLTQARERRLEAVSIPADVLRPGNNLLAIELRAAPVHPVTVHDDGFGPQREQANQNDWFAHSRIAALRLTATTEGAVSSLRRPAGMQVWVTDMHDRMYDADFLEPGAPASEVRIVGARNGTFSAQLVLAGDTDLDDVQIQVSALRHAEGKHLLDASHCTVMGSNPRPANSVAGLGGPRGSTTRRDADPHILRRRYGREPHHLDELTDTLFTQVPAGQARVAWLSFRIPGHAHPGVYTGSVHVSAAGQPPAVVPIHMEIFDWQVPAPEHFATFSGVSTEPHALLHHYNRHHHRPDGRIDMFSDPHLALIRRTGEQLARLGGGDWLTIQVLDSDHEIKWIRMKDGSLRFDFTNLGRLLDAVVDTSGKPRVVCFNIMYPYGRDYRARVPVRDEDDGEREWVELGPEADPAMREAYWKQFGFAVYGFMRARGMEDRLFWGTPWDREGDPELVYLMASILPNVYWARTSHYFLPNHYYRATSTIYAENFLSGGGFHLPQGHEPGARPIPGLESMLGWNHTENIRINNSRWHSSVHYLEGFFPAAGYRLMAERCLVAGYNGYGVFGADGWGDGPNVPFGVQRGGIGTGIVRLLWPGASGMMNTGARVEALLEGIQEAEARVFLERALLAGELPQPMAERVVALLNERLAQTAYYTRSPHSRHGQVFDIHQGWQARSRALYAMAAEAARHVGLTVRPADITLDVVAGGHHEATLRVFNNGGPAREWRLACDHPSVRLGANQGRTTVADAVAVTLEAGQAAPGTLLETRIVLTDLASGTVPRTHTIPVRVRVVPQLELQLETPVLVARPGGVRAMETVLVNQTRRELRWRATASAPWLTLSPDAGVLPPMASMPVRLAADAATAAPASRLEATLRFDDGTGQPVAAPAFVLRVEPERPALPDAEPAYLVDLDPMITYHYTLTNRRHGMPGRPARDGRTLRAQPFDPHNQGPGDSDEIIYGMAGTGFSVFAAHVAYVPRRPDQNGRARFQVITDGQIRFDTGWIEPGDSERPVVVPYLDDVQALTLLFTRENPMAGNHGDGRWIRPRFYPAPE